MCVWICDDRNNSNANSSYYVKVPKKDTSAWQSLHMLCSKQVKKYTKLFKCHLSYMRFIIFFSCACLCPSTHPWPWLWPGPCQSLCGYWPHRQRWCWRRHPPSVPSAGCLWSGLCLASLLSYCRDMSTSAWEKPKGRRPKRETKWE